MTWRKLIKKCKKDYGLNKIIWIKDLNMTYTALCNFEEGVIQLNYYQIFNNFEERVGTLFHELGHIHCYKNNIWIGYHSDDENKNIIVKTGLKAEKWIDNWAEKKMKKYYPELKYNKIYHTKEGKNIYHKLYLNQFK